MANQYLKSAASSLHQAANHLRRQANELHGMMTRTQHHLKSVINKNQLEIKTKEFEADASRDIQHRSRLSIEIQKLQDEIVAAENELKRTEQKVQSAMQAKVDMSNALESQAKQLDERSNAPELSP